MKKTRSRLMALLLALVMALSCVTPALAEEKLEPIPYDGETVNFIKADGAGFGMFTPQEGTTAVINGDNVVIHYVPKNTTVYNAIHWGAITDSELTADLAFNEDGTFDITLAKENCGKGLPVAPLKPDGGTTSAQYYLAIPSADKLKDETPEPETPEEPEAPSVEPFAYDGEEVNFIKADGNGFGMFTPQEGTTAVINGDNVVIHYVPKNTTVYNAIHWGAITDSELTADLAFNEDGTFDITLDKKNCGWALPVAPIKAKGGTTSDQYYLAIPSEDKLKEQAPDEPAPDEPTPDEPAPSGERIDLTITNNTGMFKGAYAYLETAEGETCLVVALTGTTYQYLFRGTYEEAVANGDNRDNWLVYREGPDGKYEFVFPLADGETYIPVVSISSTYLKKYENGENALERAFYPRQFELDTEAKTLTIGDYEFSQELTVTNNVKMFKVSGATLDTVGGPNSNNYKASLMLTMGSDSFDKAFIGRAGEVDEESAIAIGEGRVFDLPVKWVETFGNPETLKSLLEGPFIVSFHSVSKDAWYERQFTVSEKDGTLVIDEAPAEEAEITYIFVTGGDGTWTRGSGKDFEIVVKRSADDDTTFSRFTGISVDGKALDKADYTAVAGSVKITVKSACLETLSAGKHTVTVTFDDASAETTLTVEEASGGSDSPATGDAGIGIWAVMAAASAAGFVTLKRKKDEETA